jgi:hypothetical protein
MRRIAVIALAAAALILAGCVTSRADGSPQVQTTAEANKENVQGAAEAPLRDLNVVRTKIPDVLLDALGDPYARPPLPPREGKAAACALLEGLVKPLDEALGADLDSPAREDDSLIYRGKDAALGAMAGAASDAIPFRSWVRKLSGAERHDRLVQNAISAGAVRRAYLKGLGESHGCGPPAAASHMISEILAATKPEAPAPREPLKPLKPLHPVR